MKFSFRIVLALFSIISCLEASPPADVTERLSGAETALDSGQFVGSYSLGVSTVVTKADGSSKKTTDMEMAVEIEEGEVERRRLIRFLVDGEDRTENNREELETPPKEESDDDEDGEGDDFLAPFGDDVGRFVFGPAKPHGTMVEMAFKPAPGHEGDVGITSGVLAWSGDSLDPLWLEMEVLDPHKPMRELKVRMEFRRVGEILYMSRMVTQGKVKLLLMKRSFRMEMLVRDVEATEHD